MHVFIDTNIILNFFHFSSEELDALNNVFASHEHGAATVHLTEQVRDEFRRNRENKIKDALKKFTDTKMIPQMPSFMKGYNEYEDIRKLAKNLQTKVKAILKKADLDIANSALAADKLIHEIFQKSEIIAVTNEIYHDARRRMDVGNPPGKNQSIGDAINWIILLSHVPDGEDIHIISDDGDFFSKLDEKSTKVHPFLAQEWKDKKGSNIFVYRTLSAFTKEHFDGVAFSFDKAKDALIDELMYAGNFATTHSLIASLENYGYFSLKEVCRILEAATQNDQFGWIVTDKDVSNFLKRVAVPRRSEIDIPELLAIIDEVATKDDGA
jgi:predicted nucleic acid-binding protein